MDRELDSECYVSSMTNKKHHTAYSPLALACDILSPPNLTHTILFYITVYNLMSTFGTLEAPKIGENTLTKLILIFNQVSRNSKIRRSLYASK